MNSGCDNPNSGVSSIYSLKNHHYSLLLQKIRPFFLLKIKTIVKGMTKQKIICFVNSIS